MNFANTITESESPKGRWHEKDAADYDTSSNGKTPQQTLQSALDALSRGRFAEVLSCFDDRFRYNDHALDLEFTDKPRLTEFFQKARELFPDTTLEIVSLFESGDQAAAEWKLTATENTAYGSISYRVPVSLLGSTTVHVEYGKIVQWSDYYDQNSAHRANLAAFFSEWVEY
jgi:steroid delta-isomerase-like uncharacterized protein